MTMTAPGSVQADVTGGGPVPPGPARGLVCRNCGATFDLIAEHACAECFGPLEVDYDKDLLAAVTREQIEAGPPKNRREPALPPGGPGPADHRGARRAAAGRPGPGRPGHPRPGHDAAGAGRPARRRARAHRRAVG